MARRKTSIGTFNFGQALTANERIYVKVRIFTELGFLLNFKQFCKVTKL